LPALNCESKYYYSKHNIVIEHKNLNILIKIIKSISNLHKKEKRINQKNKKRINKSNHKISIEQIHQFNHSIRYHPQIKHYLKINLHHLKSKPLDLNILTVITSNIYKIKMLLRNKEETLKDPS